MKYLCKLKHLKGTNLAKVCFAFYAVVDDGEVASEAMLGYVDDINHELSRKRDEYGFLTMEEYMEELAAKGKAA